MQRSRMKYLAGSLALSALLYCQCGGMPKRPIVEQVAYQNIPKKTAVAEKKEEKPQKKATEPLADSWSGGKCVMSERVLRIATDDNVEYVPVPAEIEWKYLFCSDAYTVLVSDSLVFQSGSPKGLAEAAANGSKFFAWKVQSLNLPDAAPVGGVQNAEFDKELSALIVFGTKGTRLFTFDYYPYITDILFDDDGKEEKKILYAVKDGFFVFCREGDTKYALCNMKSGEHYWYVAGEQITSLNLNSVNVNQLHVKANDTVMEYYW